MQLAGSTRETIYGRPKSIVPAAVPTGMAAFLFHGTQTYGPARGVTGGMGSITEQKHPEIVMKV